MTGVERAYWEARAAWRKAAKAVRAHLATFSPKDWSWFTDPTYNALYREYKLAHDRYNRAYWALAMEKRSR